MQMLSLLISLKVIQTVNNILIYFFIKLILNVEWIF